MRAAAQSEGVQHFVRTTQAVDTLPTLHPQAELDVLADGQVFEEREVVENGGSNARQVLAIHFVRKVGGNVHGTLDPYRDPECGCQVITTFDGDFTNSTTIQGTFSTVPSVAGGRVSGGTWTARRVKLL